MIARLLLRARPNHRRVATLIAIALVLSGQSQGLQARESITVAVASNFHGIARELAGRFESEQGVTVRLSAASSGKLYTQVLHGAPFDLLLSADQKIPEKLESAQLTVPGSRFTYALGRLVLWSRDPVLKEQDCEATLRKGEFRKLAVANSRHAPYGVAAEEVLTKLGLLERFRTKLVTGENIAQTFQFAATGNATLGLIALSQAMDPGAPEAVCRWTVPANMHSPIIQQAVLLARGADKASARRFAEFLRSPAARALIQSRGYAVAAEIASD